MELGRVEKGKRKIKMINIWRSKCRVQFWPRECKSWYVIAFVFFYMAESALLLSMWLQIRLGPSDSPGQDTRRCNRMFLVEDKSELSPFVRLGWQ